MISIMCLIGNGDEYIEDLTLQIENLLNYDFSPEEICVITDFDFEYEGVKSIRIDFKKYEEKNFWLRKIVPIIDFLKMNPFDNELVWYHDLDCWLNCEKEEFEKDLQRQNIETVGFIEYHVRRRRRRRMQGGSIFFRRNKIVLDIFCSMRDIMLADRKITDEYAMKKILSKRTNYKTLNYGFNFGNFWFLETCPKIEWPIRCIHFKRRWADQRHMFFPVCQTKLLNLLCGKRRTDDPLKIAEYSKNFDLEENLCVEINIILKKKRNQKSS